MFRGVLAACLSGAVIATAGVVGTALAASPAGSGAHPAIGSAGVAPHVAIRPQPAQRRVTPSAARASRSIRRTSLYLSPRAVAHALLLRRGWSEGEWSCLDALWTRESRWQVEATNARSGAYGIPQALPASKMAAMGSDWRTDPVTQIRWGLWYIGQTYGDPCTALSHSNRYGFY
jgi:hypothetical protein